MTVLLPAVQRWECPNCRLEETTRGKFLPNRYHSCPKIGIFAPLLPAGTKAKVESRAPEDYIGPDPLLPIPGTGGKMTRAHRRNAKGQTVMSVVTTRDDGQDVVVFAPTAVAKGRVS